MILILQEQSEQLNSAEVGVDKNTDKSMKMKTLSWYESRISFAVSGIQSFFAL